MPRSNLIRALVIALFALALTAGGAVAAPARDGAVGSATAAYTWEGGPITGLLPVADLYDALGCSLPTSCDDSLLKVNDPGNVSVKISSADPGAVDIDLYVYASDAGGTQGKVVKASTGMTATESTVFEVETPGYYLVRVSVSITVGAMYQGEAMWKAPEPVEGEPGPGAPPAANAPPTSAITKLKAKVKRKSLKGFSGTAADDAGVSKVQIALVQVKGNSCKGLTSRGTFTKLKKCTAPSYLSAKGTTAWSFKLRKALAKGKYVLYSRAVDNAGLSEAGYGPKNRRAFKVV